MNKFFSVIFCACLLTCGLVAASNLSAQEHSNADTLRRYVRLAQVDPLYAWPVVDLTQMEVAIEALNASRAEILTYAKEQYTAEQQARIAIALYPTSYLSEMIELERLRRALSMASGPTDTEAYHQQLLATIEAHQNYLGVLKAALAATSNGQTYKGLEFHFGRSSFAHFIEGVEGYQADTEVMLKRAKARWQCTQTGEQDCEEPDWQVTSEPEIKEYSKEVFQQAPAKITRAIREEGKLGGQIVGTGWAILNNADCYLNKGPIPFLTWQFPTASGVPIFRPEVVSDVYVHDHRADDSSNDYERILQTLGMQGLLFQPHTNLYACPDASRDAAQLRAMVFIHKFAQEFEAPSDTIGNVSLTTALAQLKATSEQLSDASVLVENDVQAFVVALSHLLTEYEIEELDAVLGSDVRLDLENVALAYRLKTPFLSHEIMNLVYSNTAIADYVPYAPWGFLEELLFTRNGVELLAGGNNPSIVLRDYNQVERLRDGVSPRLLSYTRDLAREFGIDEMIAILLKGLDAEYRLASYQYRPHLFGK